MNQLSLLHRMERSERALFVRCVDHFELHDGEPPGPHAADIEFGDVPPGRTIDHKHLHAIVDPREPGRLVAVVESVNGYPDETTWFLGLLLVDPAHRGAASARPCCSRSRRWLLRRDTRGLASR